MLMIRTYINNIGKIFVFNRASSKLRDSGNGNVGWLVGWLVGWSICLSLTHEFFLPINHEWMNGS